MFWSAFSPLAYSLISLRKHGMQGYSKMFCFYVMCWQLFCFIKNSPEIVKTREGVSKPRELSGSDTASALLYWLKSPPGSPAYPELCRGFPGQTWNLKASELPCEHILACADPQGRATAGDRPWAQGSDTSSDFGPLGPSLLLLCF